MTAPVDVDFDLAPRERRFVVLVALVQALLLYVAQYGIDHDVWPFAALGGRVYWYTLVLTVPTSMLLSVRTLDDRRFWQQAALVAGVYALLAAWAVWTATGAAFVAAEPVLTPFAWTLAVGSFVLLPYLQARLAHGRWCAPYPFLFESAWQNALTLGLAAVFVGLGWGLLVLWAQLFKLVGIELFEDLFAEPPFVYLATGLLVGLGVLIGRTQQKPVRIARSILFALFTGLLPVLVLFSVAFLATLPFTGLDGLWDTNHASLIVALVLAHLVLFVNAVRQDGDGPAPYPAWLRRFVSAGLVASPAFALIALVALWLRIDQYGWTVERYWAAVAVALLAAHALGYAWAALRRDGSWLQRLPQVNIAVSLAAIVMMVLGNSPLLDPYRVATASQVARFHAAPAGSKLDALDAEYLRWQTGRHGVRALQVLRDDPAIAAAPDQREQIERLLAATRRWEWERPGAPALDADALARRLELAPGTAAPDAAWLDALAAGTLHGDECRRDGAECLVIDLDADADGTDERLLCHLGPAHVACWLATRRGTGWRNAGDIDFYSRGDTMPWAAIRRGEVVLEPRCWPRIGLGGMEPQVVMGDATPRSDCTLVDSTPEDPGVFD